MREDVQKVIDQLRPVLQSDGGDIELIDVSQDGIVTVRLSGACAGCPSAMITLKHGVERFLMHKVPGVREVVAG
jgi:Fe-S cluster biogenesis protein NfuA